MIQKPDLYVREDNLISIVTVADKKTGYAVAQFFYQNHYNARLMADCFIQASKECNMLFVEGCGNACGIVQPFGFVPEDGCEKHDR
jgi:hypothetical protein